MRVLVERLLRSVLQVVQWVLPVWISLCLGIVATLRRRNPENHAPLVGECSRPSLCRSSFPVKIDVNVADIVRRKQRQKGRTLSGGLDASAPALLAIHQA